MIKKILTHLHIFEEKENQRAPPGAAPEYMEYAEIVPYDDGWPGYDEPVFNF
ncbi:MAG: hypothetical protein ABR512_12775 [Desulfopila sp.]